MPIGPDAKPDVDQGIATLVHRAVEDARELARAEVALVKTKVGERATAYKAAGMYFAVAGVLALASLVALLVGLILSFATLIGPGWATALVIGVTLVIIVALGLIGKGKLAPPKGLS